MMTYQHTAHTLAWPTDWSALFGADRPLILEIGFGYAQYLVHLAKSNPNANIIGIEINNKCLEAGEAAVRRHKLDNVQIIHTPAETALNHLFAPNTLSQVHINFPDPWFKRSHDHRRLMQRDTLDALVSRLQRGGLLYLATDILDYAEMSAALLAETPGLTNRLPSAWVNHLPERGVVTKYEGKAFREGRSSCYFAYVRNDQPPPAVPVIQEYPEMPHVVFHSPLPLNEVMSQFSPQEHKLGSNVVSVTDIFAGRHSLLLDVYVKETTIDQHVAFLVVQKPDDANTYTLKLSALGHPRPTLGLHQAAALLADWLISLHPDAHTLHRKLNPVAETSLKALSLEADLT